MESREFGFDDAAFFIHDKRWNQTHLPHYPVIRDANKWQPTLHDFHSSLTFRFKNGEWPIIQLPWNYRIDTKYFYITFTNLPYAFIYNHAVPLRIVFWTGEKENMFIRNVRCEGDISKANLVIGGSYFPLNENTIYPSEYSISYRSHSQIISFIIDHCFSRGRIVPFFY